MVEAHLYLVEVYLIIYSGTIVRWRTIWDGVLA